MKKLISILLITASIVSFGQDLPPYSSEIIWSDEFDDDFIDKEKWEAQIGDGCDIDLCGWGNNEEQWYTDNPDNLRIEDGKLIIQSQKESIGDKDYTSARIRTIGKGDFKYARVEALIKVPKGKGTWSAFWMLSTENFYGGWPKSGEIDIMEFLGKKDNQAIAALHYGPSWPNNKVLSGVLNLSNGSFYDTTHLFAVEWHPYEIKWFIDSVEYFSVSPGSLYPERWSFDKKFHLIMNTAIGGNLGGKIDESIFPTQMEIDYVRVHSYTYLVGSKNVFKGDTTNYRLMGDSLGSEYVWTIPENAQIISGNGTSSLEVAWQGNEAGNITLEYKRADQQVVHEFPVVMHSTDCEILFDDFDGNKNVEYIWWKGRFTEKMENSAKDNVNPSDSVGLFKTYTLNKTEMVTMKNLPIKDASDFEEGDWSFYLDIYTEAPAGSQFQIVLENEQAVQDNFPNGGARSVFTAQNTLSGEWERLFFVLDDIVNESIPADKIDQLKLFVDIDQGGSKDFLIDNFMAKRISKTKISGLDIVECSGQTSYTIENVEGSSFVWNVPEDAEIVSGQGTNEVMVKWGAIDGNITVLQTNGQSCEAISGSLFVTTCPTGINDTRFALTGVSIYPNPGKEFISISSDESIGKSNVRFVNSFGTEVLNMQIDLTGMKTIDISEIPSGMYMIQISNDLKVGSQKFLKE